MKKMAALLVLLMMFIPALAFSQESDAEEYTLDENTSAEASDEAPEAAQDSKQPQYPSSIEKTDVKSKTKVHGKTEIEEVDIKDTEVLDGGSEVGKTEVKEVEVLDSGTDVKEVEVKIDKKIKIAPAYHPLYREGSFRAGLVGPGIYYGNKRIDAMMGIGAEAEYFFFEKLSAGLRIQTATDFKTDANPNFIASFVPQARYVFDLSNYPRWVLYVQAGAGIALIDGSNIAADIAIPGGGFWWQYNDRFSIGFDVSLYVLVRSNTAFSVFAGPVFRYQF